MVKETVQVMEFKGIPLGHIWQPDTTAPTITKTIKVTSLKDIEKLISEPAPTQAIDYTDLENIDDTMDMDLAKIGLVGCDMPNIPERHVTTTEELSNSIQKALQLSEQYLKREDKNATNS